MKFILSSLSAFLFFILPASAQWTKLNGPYGNGILEMATVDGSKLYCVSTSSNLYSSVDTGKTWQKEHESLFEYDIDRLTAGEGMMIALNRYAFPSRSFISLDSGATFNPFPAPFVDTIPNYGAFFKIVPSGIYGVSRAGIYHTIDTGQTWVSLNKNLFDTTTISSFVVYDNGNKMMLIDYDSVCFSVNNGPWSIRVVDSNLFNFYPRDLKELNGTIYLTTNNGIYRSYDDGLTWTDISTNIGNIPLGSLKIIDDKIYLMLGDELIVSDTASLNWNYTGFVPYSSDRDIFDLYKSGNTLLAATMMGIYRGDTLFTSTATPSNTGIDPYYPEGLIADGQTIHVGGSNGYFISNDGGITWTGPEEPIACASIKKYSNDIFICKYGEMWHGTPGSTTVSYLNATPGVELTKTALGDLYTSSYGGGVYRSNDNGNTFNPVNNGLTDLTMSPIESIGNNVVVGNYADGLFLTTDSGANWIQGNGTAGYEIYEIGKHNNLLFAEAVTYGLLVSSDSGYNWNLVPNSINGGNYNYLLSNGSVLLEINTQPGGFGSAAASTDDGQSWWDISAAFPPTLFGGEIASIYLSNDTLYLASANKGVWLVPIPVLLSTASLSAQQDNIKIFPNPATNSITIAATGLKNNFVTEIMDVMGRSVLKAHNKNKIDISQLPAGIYSVKVQAEGSCYGRKFVKGN